VAISTPIWAVLVFLVAFSTPIWAVLVFLVAFSPVFGELLAI